MTNRLRQHFEEIHNIAEVSMDSQYAKDWDLEHLDEQLQPAYFTDHLDAVTIADLILDGYNLQSHLLD